jgi:lipopolysaccharide export system permease protein
VQDGAPLGFTVKIISRYVLKEVFTFFSISLLTFTGLLLTVRMLKLTSLIVNRGVEIGQIATVFLAIIPTFLEIALPMATLLGVMLAFARMCGDSEIVVLRASGISLLKFIVPIGIFAAVVGGTGLFVSFVLRPWGFSALSSALFEIARSKSTSGLTEGVFNKIGQLTLYAEKIDYQTGDLSKVIVDDKRNDTQRKVVVAKHGKIVADEATQTISLLLGEGVAHETDGQNYSRTAFQSNSLSVNPMELKEDAKKGQVARELPGARLQETINHYKEKLRSTEEDQIEVYGQTLSRKELLKKFRRAKIEYGQRLSLPYASVVMAFVGMALGIMSPRTQRTWGAGFAATLGLVVFILYYSIFSIGLTMADSGALKVWIALWAPNIITTAIAALLVYKVGTEQWQSVSEGAQRLIERLGKLTRRWRKA